MRNFESLNNARKTVLKLEKELNAISNNLSKAKNKDHSTMKKIINKINYLLTNNSIEKLINKKEENDEKKENKSEERQKTHIYNKNSLYSDREKNYDYFSLINKQKNINSNNNNVEQNSNNSNFNKKYVSSSRIRDNNSLEEKKILHPNNNCNTKINILNQNKQMTYLKPRLKTENIKKNSNNKLIIHNNNPIGIRKQISNEQIKNITQFGINENNLKSNLDNNLSKYKKKLTSLSIHFKDNYSKENFIDEDNKDNFPLFYEEEGIFDLKNDINLKLDKKKQDRPTSAKNNISAIKKNKKLILEKKIKKNEDKELLSNQNNIYNNSAYQYYRNNIENKNIRTSYTCLNFDKNNNMNRINISEKIIRNGRNNHISLYDDKYMRKLDENSDYNNLEKNNTCTNLKNHRKIKDNIFRNLKNSKSLNPKNNLNKKYNIINNNINDKTKFDQLLYFLNVNNINDAILKVNNLLKYEKDIYKLKHFYNNKSNKNENLCYNFNFDWLSSLVQKYKKNEKYKNYCKNIMDNFKIKNFNNFKIIINNILSKDNNKDLIHNINNILLKEDNLEKNNITNINSKKYVNNNMRKDLNNNLNNKENILINRNNINYMNSNKSNIINEYKNEFMNTYY